MERFTRRQFFKINAALGVTAAACSQRPVEIGGLIEQEGIEREPRAGDVLISASTQQAFLTSSNGKRYPFYDIADLQNYVTASKLNEYGRGIFAVSPDVIDNYQEATPPQKARLISPFTGLPTPNQMGEVALLWQGMQSEGDLAYELTPTKTFPSVIEGLSQQEWQNMQALMFTYGHSGMMSLDEALERGGFGYDVLDTLRPLSALKEKAVEYTETIHELLPYCQKNSIGHSLGGLLLLQAAMEHPDFFNCLVLMNSPARGIKKDLVRGSLYDLFKSGRIKTNLPREYVFGILTLAGDLFALWEDKDYQKRLDDFTTSFVARGGKIINVIDESDPIVRPEESVLKEAKEVRIKSGFSLDYFSLFRQLSAGFDVGYLLEIVRAHGYSLPNETVLREIKKQFGQNMSVPIGA